MVICVNQKYVYVHIMIGKNVLFSIIYNVGKIQFIFARMNKWIVQTDIDVILFIYIFDWFQKWA